MMREAIVLAGGLGTRLKSVVPDLPKCLAPVAGKPFLDYLLLYFREKGIRRFLFALGYKAEPVEAFVKSRLSSTEYVFSIEQEPLGTGGAIRKACRQAFGTEVLVLNADSFFGVDPVQLSAFHEEKKADCTLALKPMRQFDRYGVVELNERQQVCGFSEKKYTEAGLINGGVYVLQADRFLNSPLPDIFSFERDYLEKEYRKGKICGMVSDAYFIDIGIPEDYFRAQKELIQFIPDGI